MNKLIELNFSLDDEEKYMDDTMIYTVDGEDQLEENEVSPDKVEEYARRLSVNFPDHGFSEWMTEIFVTIREGKSMDITWRYFTEPDSDSFFDIDLKELPVDFPNLFMEE